MSRIGSAIARSSHAALTPCDVKSLTRWSNQPLAKLRAHLDTQPFERRVLVSGGVHNRRLTGIGVLRYENTDTTFSLPTTSTTPTRP